MNSDIRVAVLMGGFSSERDISLKSGKGVLSALLEKGFRAEPFDVKDGLLSGFEPEKFDVAFIALHGEFGEDGGVQSLLEGYGLPYTGSGVDASRLAMDKVLAKERFKAAGVRVAPHVRLNSVADLAKLNGDLDSIGLPLVVKPVAEGSSIGVTRVTDWARLSEAVEAAAKFQNGILIEPFIPGHELTVAIFGEEALPVIEIVPPGNTGWFDYFAKYGTGYDGPKSEYLVPAPLEESLARRVREAALTAHLSLGCRDVSRVDFRLEPDADDPVVLEVNTIPGMTPTSLLPKAAGCVGIGYADVCAQLVGAALLRAGRLAA